MLSIQFCTLAVNEAFLKLLTVRTTGPDVVAV